MMSDARRKQEQEQIDLACALSLMESAAPPGSSGFIEVKGGIAATSLSSPPSGAVLARHKERIADIFQAVMTRWEEKNLPKLIEAIRQIKARVSTNSEMDALIAEVNAQFSAEYIQKRPRETDYLEHPGLLDSVNVESEINQLCNYVTLQGKLKNLLTLLDETQAFLAKRIEEKGVQTNAQDFERSILEILASEKPISEKYKIISCNYQAFRQEREDASNLNKLNQKIDRIAELYPENKDIRLLATRKCVLNSNPDSNLREKLTSLERQYFSLCPPHIRYIFNYCLLPSEFSTVLREQIDFFQGKILEEKLGKFKPLEESVIEALVEKGFQPLDQRKKIAAVPVPASAASVSAPTVPPPPKERNNSCRFFKGTFFTAAGGGLGVGVAFWCHGSMQLMIIAGISGALLALLLCVVAYCGRQYGTERCWQIR